MFYFIFFKKSSGFGVWWSMVLGNGQMMISCALSIMLSWASGKAQAFGDIFSVQNPKHESGTD